jgi:DNA-binding MarR family transcriptional regulator
MFDKRTRLRAVMSTATSTTTSAPPDAFSAAELQAWKGLLCTHAMLAKRLDAELERAHGVPLSSFEVLHHLGFASEGRMRMCDLADSIHLSRSGLTRLVDRLERDGLLERCSCDHDARGAYACLTDRGREQLLQAKQTYVAAVREHFLSHFDEQELELLVGMWNRVRPAGCCNAGAGPVS